MQIFVNDPSFASSLQVVISLCVTIHTGSDVDCVKQAEPVRKRRKKAAATSAVEPSPEDLPEADEGAGEANPTTARIPKGKGSRKVAKPKPKANGKRTKGAAVKHDSPADEEVQQADGQIPDQENSQDKIQVRKAS